MAGFSVRRSSRARRARLTVGREGEVVVVLPPRAPLDLADRLVRDHAGWIARQRGRALARLERLDARPPLGEGRMLSVAGLPYRVQVVDGVAARPARGRVDVHPETIIVRLGRDGRALPTLLEGWLRQQARACLAERVAARASEIGVSVGRLSVRDQRSRWGSASPSGSLSFSWRLVLAPPEVLDAVVVHELAHLRHRDHGPAFWRLVLRHAPGTSAARRWLREHGPDLWAALT